MGLHDDFPTLVAHIWNKATHFDQNIGMSKPHAPLMQLYGPLTDKLSKDRCVREGQEFYDNYLLGKIGTPEWAQVSELTSKIRKVCTQTTNGYDGAKSKLELLENDCTSALSDVISNSTQQGATPVRNGILAAGDVLIAQSMSFIPIAGPIISVALSAATAGAASAILNSPNSSAGVATLCYLGVKRLTKSAHSNISENAAKKSQTFITIQNQLTQNQTAAAKIGDIGYSKSDPNISAILNKSAEAFRKIEAVSTEQTETLSTFNNRCKQQFINARDLLISLSNASIMSSFEPHTSYFTIDPSNDTNELRIALLIIGYYKSKDWAGELKEARADYINSDSSNRVLNKLQTRNIALLSMKYNKKVTLYPSKENALSTKLNLMANNDKLVGPSAQNVLSVAKDSLSKKVIKAEGADPTKQFPAQVNKELYMLKRYVKHGCDYVEQVKNALTSDIETVLHRGNQGNGMSKDDYTEMWNLYIGSMLIISHTLQYEQKNTVLAGRKIRYAIEAPKIPSNYVNMIDKATFLRPYRTWLGKLQEKDKVAYADEGKIRYAAHPSDAEVAMLVTFCALVVYSVDIGRISLGYLSWEQTKLDLRDACRAISNTRTKKPIPADADWTEV